MRGPPSRASAAIAAMRSADSTVPVGLAGELMTIAFVRGPRRSPIASGRYWKPSSSVTPT